MSRYIDAERLYNELEQLYKDNGWERMEVHFSLSDMECNIHFMPTANVRENAKAEWVEQVDYNGDSYYDCSVCGESWTTLEGTPWEYGMNYCPNCGARMVSVDD